MPKLHWPENREELCKAVLDKMAQRSPTGPALVLPKKGRGTFVSHQLGLQRIAEDDGVCRAVEEVIGRNLVTLSEPEWAQKQNKVTDVWHCRLAG